MAFLTDEQLASFVKDHVAKGAGASLQANWTSIVSQANAAAYNEILAAFASRGFTKAQIDLWDRGAEFERDIGAWWALTHNAALFTDTYNAASLAALDRRKELWGDPQNHMPPAPLLTDGVWVDPASKRGQVTFGTFREDDQLHGIEDANDSRRGQITRL